ncbi:RHS repeat-associated core domain-containing protein [Streptomyces pilosus]
MPATTRFLDSLGLDFMYVRLARLKPHSYLWEHRDYAELRDTGRHRLHIPLVTNPSAVLVTASARVYMAAGALWRLTPSQAHGVCNTTGPDRLHLIADVYADDAYQTLAARPHLRDGDATDLAGGDGGGTGRAAGESRTARGARLHRRGGTDAATTTSPTPRATSSASPTTRASGTHIYAYGPTGLSRGATTEAAPQPHRYAGTYLDPTGLYKMGHRYYDPTLGRFTQPDPSGQETNPYLHASGDSNNNSDPSGLLGWPDIGEGVGAFAGGVLGVAATAAVCSTGIGCVMAGIALVGLGSGSGASIGSVLAGGNNEENGVLWGPSAPARQARGWDAS